MITVIAGLVEHSAAEKHAEDLLWVNFLLESVLAEATAAARGLPAGLTVARFLSGHIIHSTLFRIGETGIRGGYFLECICGLWCLILIRMQLDSQFLVRLLDVILLCVLSDTENLIVVPLA